MITDTHEASVNMKKIMILIFHAEVALAIFCNQVQVNLQSILLEIDFIFTCNRAEDVIMNIFIKF